MALPLEVLADLQLAVDGEEIDIQGDGKRIVVDLPTLRAGRRLVTSGPFAMGDRASKVSRLHEAMDIAGLRVEVRLRGDPIARLGAGTQPNTLSRLLNLGAVELRPTRPLLRAARRRPLVTGAVVVGLVLLIGWLLRRNS